MAADFHLRFTRHFSEYPWRLFRLAHTPRSEPSEARQAVANELRALGDNSVGHQMAAKFRRVFAERLKHAAAAGAVEERLLHSRSKEDRDRLVRFAIEKHAGAEALVDSPDRFAVVETLHDMRLSQPSQPEHLPLGDTDIDPRGRNRDDFGRAAAAQAQT
eukprot:2811776-Alexandrium_andersonii.AAC.1